MTATTTVPEGLDASLAATYAKSGAGRDMSWRLILGWGVGAGALAVMDFSKILLLPFFVDNVGMSAVIAGTLLGLSKLFDMMVNPWIGALSDRTSTPWGRRRPFMLVGSVGFFVAWYALYHVPNLPQGTLLIGYCVLILFLYSLVYGAFNVTYVAMPSEMTDHYDTRSLLMSGRAAFQSVGFSIAGYLGPVLIGYYGGGRAGHAAMSLVLGLLTLAFGLICVVMTSGARALPPNQDRRVTFGAQIALLGRNPYFLILIVSAVFLMISVSMMNAAAIFFLRSVLHATDSRMGLLFAALSLATLASLPLWVMVCRVIGKRPTYIIGIVALAAGSASWYFATPTEPMWIFLLRVLVSGVGSGGVLMTGQAMLPDTMDYDRRITGLRREGVFAALYATVATGSAALGIELVGLIIGAAGYVPKLAPGIEQSPRAIWAIVGCFAGLPAILLLISGAVIAFYGLSEAKLNAAGPRPD